MMIILDFEVYSSVLLIDCPEDGKSEKKRAKTSLLFQRGSLKLV
jgi:hypothetical protein